MLRRIKNKLSGILFDKPLDSPSDKEIAYQEELKEIFGRLQVSEPGNAQPSELEWLNNIKRLHELVLTQDTREFLRWDVIKNTMYVVNSKYIADEYRYLKKLKNWNIKWKNALIESKVGRPILYNFSSKTSGNLIHHSYHLAKFEEKTGIKPEKMDYIFEFGGGYGSICRLLFNLGFKGKYIIFDLQEFSALQQYYLKMLGLPVMTDNNNNSETGIYCISDINLLKEFVTYKSNTMTSLFIATWSLSETPLAFRNIIVPLISSFTHYLIAYQEKFGEMNNVEYFNNWAKTSQSIIWNSWQINQIPGSYYLVGSKRL